VNADAIDRLFLRENLHGLSDGPRSALAQSLAADADFTEDVLRALLLHAKSLEAGNPRLLAIRWLETGVWRDYLADVTSILEKAAATKPAPEAEDAWGVNSPSPAMRAASERSREHPSQTDHYAYARLGSDSKPVEQVAAEMGVSIADVLAAAERHAKLNGFPWPMAASSKDFPRGKKAKAKAAQQDIPVTFVPDHDRGLPRGDRPKDPWEE
jgi:hypothetical protein